MVSGAVRHYAGGGQGGPDLRAKREAGEGVESAAGFERADALEGFAFEVEAEGGVGGTVLGRECGLGAGGKGAERGVGEERGEMNVWTDEVVSGDDGVAGQRRGG